MLRSIRLSQRPKKSLSHIALKVYGYDAKGNISDIERGLRPIDEDKLRIWVEALEMDMKTFLNILLTHEISQ